MTGLSNGRRLVAAAVFAVAVVVIAGCSGVTGQRQAVTPYQTWYLDGSDYDTYGGR